MSILKFKDSDTGESSLDIVEVPEGLSLQLALPYNESILKEIGGYLSIILNQEQEVKLRNFLFTRQERHITGVPLV